MATLVGQPDSATMIQVGMGQIATGRVPARMKAVLGSCIGLVLYYPPLRSAVMAHIVLPNSSGRTGAPGKFVDTAIPEMLRMLGDMGVPQRGLRAKFAGGANMFRSTGPLQIGDANAKAVADAVRNIGARLEAREVGGTQGRRITFDCARGELTIESAGHPKRIL